MTGGTAVILGPVGDELRRRHDRRHGLRLRRGRQLPTHGQRGQHRLAAPRSRRIGRALLKGLIDEHAEETQSKFAARLLNDWAAGARPLLAGRAEGDGRPAGPAAQRQAGGEAGVAIAAFGFARCEPKKCHPRASEDPGVAARKSRRLPTPHPETLDPRLREGKPRSAGGWRRGRRGNLAAAAGGSVFPLSCARGQICRSGIRSSRERLPAAPGEGKRPLVFRGLCRRQRFARACERLG